MQHWHVCTESMNTPGSLRWRDDSDGGRGAHVCAESKNGPGSTSIMMPAGQRTREWEGVWTLRPGPVRTADRGRAPAQQGKNECGDSLDHESAVRTEVEDIGVGCGEENVCSRVGHCSRRSSAGNLLTIFTVFTCLCCKFFGMPHLSRFTLPNCRLSHLTPHLPHFSATTLQQKFPCSDIHPCCLPINHPGIYFSSSSCSLQNLTSLMSTAVTTSIQDTCLIGHIK